MDDGDILIFPSGNRVSWKLPPREVMPVGRSLRQLGIWFMWGDAGTEDLEYVGDSRIHRSRIVGRVIILGTAGQKTKVG